jgi:histidinol-phosphate phosphatase family protein
LSYDVVIPSARRDSLRRLLASLAADGGPAPERVIVVDDRGGGAPLELDTDTALAVTVVRGGSHGPAAARNAGWRAARAEWVAFLDDDVVLPGGWRVALGRDLERLGPRAAASQGRIVVPLPDHRRPTDWERNVQGLERARFATADMAYRRSALEAVGGFDERFPRAYREDADLALRVRDAGFEIHTGERHVLHPVRPAGVAVSLHLQAGNADDALMRALHGPRWRERAGAPPGRLALHLLTTAAGVTAAAALVARRRRPAAVAGAAWLAATVQLAAARIAPGPRTPREILTMSWTSALMPPVASFQRGRGTVRGRRLLRRPSAVLLDRDGTLVEDVPYNGDPAAVRMMPGARAALDRLRAAGVRLAVVSNQSGIGRGLVSEADVRAVNARVEELLGPLGVWRVCPHAPDEPCWCRKPAPGLIIGAAAELGVAPGECVVIGDIGADMDAARAAGARAILVPTPRTRSEEVAAAPAVAGSIEHAVDLVLEEARR